MIIFNDIGEDYWSKKIESEINNFNNDKVSFNEICYNIFSWYGGMGSFNDLYICKENGFDIPAFNREVQFC